MKHTKSLQVGVKTLLVDKQGRFLVMKRNPVKYPQVTHPWDIVGGRIDPEGDLLSNLSREVAEETALKIKNSVILAAQDILKPEIHVVRITYISRVTSGKVILSEEHTEYKWLTLAEIGKLKGLDSYVKAALKDKTVVDKIKNYIK